MYQRRNNRGRELGVLLLIYQMAMVGFDQIPPVTLSMILGMAAIYLGFVPSLDPAYRTYDLCVHASKIWHRQEWWRLIAPALMHASDMHLYFNMVSFMWKGRRLERHFGSLYFAYLLAVFTILTNIVMVALSIGLDEYTLLDMRLSNQCAVGFSGVIFALKVVAHHYSPNEASVVGGLFVVPGKWAAWAELVLIQLMVPQASFVGHLAGILVGLGYTNGYLKSIMDSFLMPDVSYPRHRTYNTNWSQSQGYTTGRRQQSNSWWSYLNPFSYFGTSDDAYRDYYRNRPGSSHYAEPDYDRYSGGMSEEDQIRRAMENSLRDTRYHRPTAPPYPEDYGMGAGGYPDLQQFR